MKVVVLHIPGGFRKKKTHNPYAVVFENYSPLEIYHLKLIKDKIFPKIPEPVVSAGGIIRLNIIRKNYREYIVFPEHEVSKVKTYSLELRKEVKTARKTLIFFYNTLQKVKEYYAIVWKPPYSANYRLEYKNIIAVLKPENRRLQVEKIFIKTKNKLTKTLNQLAEQVLQEKTLVVDTKTAKYFPQAIHLVADSSEELEKQYKVLLKLRP